MGVRACFSGQLDMEIKVWFFHIDSTSIVTLPYFFGPEAYIFDMFEELQKSTWLNPEIWDWML